jgi:hypothetical protein
MLRLGLRRSITTKPPAPASTPSTFKSRDTEYEELDGNIDSDGLNRYELDLFECSSWTAKLLSAMESDKETLKGMRLNYLELSRINS